jgi:hypothetical protein
MEGILVAETSPTGADRDDDFNRWYDEVHAPQALALAGFESLCRYHAVTQVVPPAEIDIPRYVAIYALSDVDSAMAALAGANDSMAMSDAVDLTSMKLTVFTKIYDSSSAQGSGS